MMATSFGFFTLIPLLFMAALYILGIIALVYLIKALRVYINKNESNGNKNNNNDNNHDNGQQ